MTDSDDHGESVDPKVRALTGRKVEEDIKTYIKLLDSNASEQRIHSFLASHSYFFNGLIRLGGASPLYSKVRLGSDYEIDFVWFDAGSLGLEWSLAEIEPPQFLLFNREGDPSARLTHAIGQIRNWQTWVDDHKEYAEKLMPGIEHPLGLLFMGRRSELSSMKAQKKLRQLAFDQRMFLRIHTLDWFAQNAESVVNLVERGGGTWWLPMNAYSHRKLAASLPKVSRRWIDKPYVKLRSRSMLKVRLDDRRDGYAEYERELDNGS